MARYQLGRLGGRAAESVKSSSSTTKSASTESASRTKATTDSTKPSTSATQPRTTSTVSTKTNASQSGTPTTLVVDTRPVPSNAQSALVPLGPYAGSPSVSAQPQNAGNVGPQKYYPHEHHTILSRGAEIAAITLGIFGIAALILGLVVCMKRRKRRQNDSNQRTRELPFNVGTNDSLRVPETARVNLSPSIVEQANKNSHLTRSTDMSDTLYSGAPYTRPETVTTNRKNLPVPPTPNPFADPPRNKAYDVLRGRPRSTTLTDRGSWAQNPFQDPESDRFDPFGELDRKARRERAKQVDEARRKRVQEDIDRARMAEENRMVEAQREAELMREFEEMERAFAVKEKMGLTPDGLARRKESLEKVEGLRLNGQKGY